MPAAPEHFGTRLTARVAARESQVVVGLDPDPARLWPGVEPAGPAAAQRDPRARAAAAVEAHCRAVLDAVADAVVAVKPQAACFERLGGPGHDALEAVCAHARDLGLLVLADVKRGDIGVTARAYAQAWLSATPTPHGDVPGLGADAITASPYLGEDSLVPMLDEGRPHGRGIVVLVRTSNPGAADLQDVQDPGGEPLWALAARLVDRLGSDAGDGGGLSDVGAVCGATRPEHLEALRGLMPRAPFLLPGVGAQGGRVADLGPAVAPGRAGALVTASRSLVDAHRDAAPGSDPAAAARAAAEALREQAWALGDGR
jgi:orotidine-5'-phosphate decarboxylase